MSVVEGRAGGIALEPALGRLAASSAFERSAGLLRLLRFLLTTAERQPEALKETFIGVSFYGRDASYDPRNDAIVRVNAMRLRQRLAEYYRGEGMADPVRIEMPRGSYVPLVLAKGDAGPAKIGAANGAGNGATNGVARGGVNGSAEDSVGGPGNGAANGSGNGAGKSAAWDGVRGTTAGLRPGALSGASAEDVSAEGTRLESPVVLDEMPGRGAAAAKAGPARFAGAGATLPLIDFGPEQDPILSVLSMAAAKPKGRRWDLVVAGLALLTALCAGAVYLGLLRHGGRVPDFVSAQFQAVPLTAGSDLEFEPAISPDGRTLAFVTRRAPGGRTFGVVLRSMAGDGRPDRALATGAGTALYPAWSPDGQRMAFLRCDLGPCEIATMAVHGGGAPQAVMTLPTYALSDDQPYYQYRQLNPVWTADGKGLIFPYRGVEDDSERLVEVDLASGRRRQLTSGAASDEDAAPALSPDGRWVAFLRRHLTWTDVMVLDLATGSAEALTREPNVTASGVTWAHDGSGVVVGTNRRKGWALVWVPRHGPTRELNVRLPVVMNPVFSPDGNSLLILQVNRSRNLAEVEGEDGAARPLGHTKQRNSYSAFSPNGEQIAFLSDLSGSFEVWLAQREGSSFAGPRQLTHGLGWYPSSVSWSPNGATLAVGILNSNEVDMVDVHSGRISRLRLPGLEHSVVWSPVWSSDGQWVYLGVSGERNGIYRASASPVPMVEPVAPGAAREVRVDGDRALYFAPAYGHGIFRVALQGDARPEPVAQLAKILPARDWMIEDGTLYYLDVHDPVARLHSFNLQTGAMAEVSGPLTRPAFEYGTLSYLAKTRLLVYSEWAEAAGSQVLALRWR